MFHFNEITIELDNLDINKIVPDLINYTGRQLNTYMTTIDMTVDIFYNNTNKEIFDKFLNDLKMKLESESVRRKFLKKILEKEVPYYFVNTYPHEVENDSNMKDYDFDSFDILYYRKLERDTNMPYLEFTHEYTVKVQSLLNTLQHLLRITNNYLCCYLEKITLQRQYIKNNIIKKDLARGGKQIGNAIDIMINEEMNIYLDLSRKINEYLPQYIEYNDRDISCENLSLYYYYSINFNFQYDLPVSVIQDSRKNPNNYTNVTIIDSFRRNVPISSVF
jgi:hypothetical protein